MNLDSSVLPISNTSEQSWEQESFSPSQFPRDVLYLIFDKCARRDLLILKTVSKAWKVAVEASPFCHDNSLNRTLLKLLGIVHEEGLRNFEQMLPHYRVKSDMQLASLTGKRFNPERLKIGALYRSGCQESILTHRFRIDSFEDKQNLLGIGDRYLFRRDERLSEILVIQDRACPKKTIEFGWEFQQYGYCLACCVPEQQEDVFVTLSISGYIHWWKITEYDEVVKIKEEKLRLQEGFYGLPISAAYRLGNYMVLLGGYREDEISSWIDLDPNAEKTFINPPGKTLGRLKKHRHFAFTLNTMYYLKDNNRIGCVYIAEKGKRFNFGKNIRLDPSVCKERLALRVANGKWLCCSSTAPKEPTPSVLIRTYIYRLSDGQLIDTLVHDQWSYRFVLKGNLLTYCEYNLDPYFSTLHFRLLSDEGALHIFKIDLSSISEEILNQFRYFISDDLRKISILSLARSQGRLRLYELEIPEPFPAQRIARCMQLAKQHL